MRLKISEFYQISSFACPEWQKCPSLFFAKFSTWLKISWFWPISFFAGSEWSKISFWAKFWTWLKISGFCQFSSFTGPEWTKLAILIQILTRTKNYRILPNFILHMSWAVKNVSFELNFDTNQNFLILQNCILRRSEVVKLSISS